MASPPKRFFLRTRRGFPELHHPGKRLHVLTSGSSRPKRLNNSQSCLQGQGTDNSKHDMSKTAITRPRLFDKEKLEWDNT
jgi:hypothetical protein